MTEYQENMAVCAEKLARAKVRVKSDFAEGVLKAKAARAAALSEASAAYRAEVERLTLLSERNRAWHIAEYFKEIGTK